MHGIGRLKLSQAIESRILGEIARLGYSITNPAAIAQSIESLSDYYIQNPTGKTPYHKPWAQIASLAYYLPLNLLRCAAAVNHAKSLGFFEGLRSGAEIGSGLGALTLAMEMMDVTLPKFLCAERSDWASELHGRLQSVSWLRRQTVDVQRDLKEAVDLYSFSYALTEFSSLPISLKSVRAVLIVEPGTREDGQKLIEVRRQLISEGFHIWAPCTHQDACSMTARPRDWCHDRIDWEQPDWYEAVEAQLPMQNRTLPFAYLLARRDPPPIFLGGFARTVGDVLVEKGRVRQQLCRGAEREFVVWQKRDAPEGGFPRGTLVTLRPDVKKAGDGWHAAEGDCSLAQWPNPH